MGQNDFDMTITANMALALLKLANQPAIRSITRSRGPPSLDLPFMHDLPFHQSGSLSLKQFH